MYICLPCSDALSHSHQFHMKLQKFPEVQLHNVNLNPLWGYNSYFWGNKNPQTSSAIRLGLQETPHFIHFLFSQNKITLTQKGHKLQIKTYLLKLKHSKLQFVVI